MSPNKFTTSKQWKLILLLLIILIITFLRELTTTITSVGVHQYLFKSANWSNLKKGYILSIHCNLGRLGNQMGTYATLLGLAALNNRTTLSQANNLHKINKYFSLSSKQISDQQLNKLRHYKIGSFLQPEYSNLPKDDLFLDGYLYPLSYTFFNHIRPKIMSEFCFLLPYKEYAQKILASASKNASLTTASNNQTFVGIHIRRTDYNSHQLRILNARQVDMEYFEKAMSYFRNKFSNIVFIAVSDDRKWLKENFRFNDTIIPPEPSEAVYDMAVLVECNHTIMSYGSFGFWSAYLTGGETLYFADYVHPNSSYLQKMPYNVTYLPSWIGISTTSSNYWENVTDPH